MVSRSVEAISTPVMKIIFRTMLRFAEVLHRSMPGSGRVGLAGGTRGEKPAETGPAALFQSKSFLLRPCVIGLIFNELGRLPENLAGQ